MWEFMFGNKNARWSPYTSADALAHETLLRALAAPSLYDEDAAAAEPPVTDSAGLPVAGFQRALPGQQTGGRRLARRVPTNADTAGTCTSSPSACVTSTTIIQLWRCHHLKTVERIIGYKPGTGGPAAFPISPKALELKFFPELWQIRTSM